MARKPANFTWLGFTEEQVRLLNHLDFYGNNAWSPTGQTEEVMPALLGDFERVGLPLVRVKEAMASIGYSKHAVHQLDRWESKRTTGKLGK